MNSAITEKPRRGRPVDPQRVETKKREILNAAAICFGEFGYAQTDVNRIAEDIGITKGTIYHYFGSKENLFLATVDAEALRMKNAVLEAADAQGDALEEMVALIFAYLKFAEANPQFVELLVEERATFKDRKQNTYFAHRDTTLPRWHRCVRTLIEDGRAHPCDPERFVSVLADTLYGTMFTNYFAGTTMSAAEQADTIIDTLFNGILKEPYTAKRTSA